MEADSARHLSSRKGAIKKETGAFYRDGKCIKWVALKKVGGKKEKENNKQEIERTGAERTGEEREVFNSIVKASYE